MYSVSDAYKTAVSESGHKFNWYGTITATDGKVYNFDLSDIVSGTGSIARSCEGSTSVEPGTVYASEFDMTLHLSADRYTLYDGKINLYYTLDYVSTPRTWGQLESYTWGDVAGATWDEVIPKQLIPMGIWTISEATKSGVDSIAIKSYDNMLDFDVDLPSTLDNSAKLPYAWLAAACSACGVTLGTSEIGSYILANGTTKLAYANGVDDSVTTWRDLISVLGVATCSVAQIGRDGKLYMYPFGTKSLDTISDSARYSSDISDYVTSYGGLYAEYKEGSLDEYVGESNASLVYDAGTNPFLQITDAANRKTALNNLYAALKNIAYVPFTVTMVCDPKYDPMDVITLSGGQADSDKISCVTDMTIPVNGSMKVKCVGENPKLAQAQSRYTKNIEGLSSSTTTGQTTGSTDFWLLFDNAGNAISFSQTTDYQRTQTSYTATYTLSVKSTVTVTVSVDGTAICTATEIQDAGSHVLTVVQAYLVEGSGTHEVTATMTATEVSS